MDFANFICQQWNKKENKLNLPAAGMPDGNGNPLHAQLRIYAGAPQARSL